MLRLNAIRKISLSKKSQAKIKEMMFMLVFLAVFFVIVGLFYLTITSSGLKKDVYESTKAGAIMLAVRLADSPEFNCGSSNCIDTDKLVVLNQNLAYVSFWQVDGLVIKRLFPSQNSSVECTPGTYPNCNTYTIKSPSNYSSQDSSYVSLCRIESKNNYFYKKCELGKIIIYTSTQLSNS